MNFSRKKRCNPISPTNELDLIHSYSDIKNDIKNKFKFCVPVRVVGYSEKKDYNGRSMLLVQPIDHIAIDGPTGELDSSEYYRGAFCVNSLEGLYGNYSIPIGTRGFVIGCDKDNYRTHLNTGSSYTMERGNTHEYTYGFFISEYKIDREQRPGDIGGTFGSSLLIYSMYMYTCSFGTSRVTFGNLSVILNSSGYKRIIDLYESYLSNIGSNKKTLLDIVICISYDMNYRGSMTGGHPEFAICNHIEDGFYIKQSKEDGTYLHNGIEFKSPCVIYPVYCIDFSDYTKEDNHDGTLNGLRIMNDYRRKCPEVIPYWHGFGIFDYLKDNPPYGA